MERDELAAYRLANQQIASTRYKDPGEIVSFMGAMQAQDYPASLWAIGLRLKGATKKDIEAAISDKSIVRTWPMRYTLHFVSHKDVKWMLGLYREKTIPNYQKKNGLTDEILKHGERIILKAFDGKSRLSSKEIYSKMSDSNNAVLKKREVQMHILRRAGRDGIVCYASHEGKQPTFALLNEWIKEPNRLSKEQAVAELASKYFTSHGPATIKDFVWWSGLRVSDAKLGIESSSAVLAEEKMDEKTYYMSKKMPKLKGNETGVHLLPAFDEYLISYSDRSAILGNPSTQKYLESGTKTFIHSSVYESWPEEI